MLSVKEIKELIKAVNESDLEEFSFEEDGTKVHFKKSTQASYTHPAAPSLPVASAPIEEKVQPQVQEHVSTERETVAKGESKGNLHTITSPMVGTFYSAPSPDSADYVSEGDDVSETSVVCIVEAMKLMNEIEAEIKGKIVEVLAENGELVEYGQPLFVVEPR